MYFPQKLTDLWIAWLELRVLCQKFLKIMKVELDYKINYAFQTKSNLSPIPRVQGGFWKIKFFAEKPFLPKKIVAVNMRFSQMKGWQRSLCPKIYWGLETGFAWLVNWKNN